MNNTTPEQWGLPTHAVEKIRGIFSQYPQIESVLLYGSRAKGNYRQGSDIDLCIQGKNLDLTTLLNIENQLDDLLLPWSIDLSLLHQIENLELVEHIKCVGVCFYPA